ncbi:MAG: ornithine cyclodeaminase [Alsobacter sp.]
MTPTAYVDTRYLSAPDVVEIVRRRGLPAILTAMAERIEREFRRWPSFDLKARVPSHSEEGVIELMPVADATHFAFKCVNGHPGNTRLGLPTVMAFGVVADMATGAPTLFSELTLTTAMRTAAASAVAARALARPGSRTMALIGNGAQSEFQALAFHHLLGIDTLRLFDVDAAATAKLMRNLRSVPGLRLEPCRSAAEAVSGSDIVTTATADKARAAILTPEMIVPGLHVNAVGGDCPGKTELHPGVLEQGRVFVEYEPQTRIEGDIQQMAPDFPVTELWRVLSGQAAGRVSPAEVTIFDSVGFALEDFAALQVMGELAQELGIGSRLSLVPLAADPKDLFGLISPAAASLAA